MQSHEKKSMDLTFDADNVVSYLLAQDGIWDGFYEVINGVD